MRLYGLIPTFSLLSGRSPMHARNLHCLVSCLSLPLCLRLPLTHNPYYIRHLPQHWAREQGMNSYLAVGQGSDEPPKFLEIEYTNAALGTDAPCVLVRRLFPRMLWGCRARRSRISGL